MRAGTLRDRITIQDINLIPDPAWGPQPNYEKECTVWASVIPQSATEKVESQAVQASTRYIIRIRYRKYITPSHRIIWRGHTLNILSIIDVDNRHREIEILATEYQKNGC